MLKKYMRDIISILLDCFDEKLEVMFFFKTCFFNIELDFKQLRKTLLAVAKTYEQYH